MKAYFEILWFLDEVAKEKNVEIVKAPLKMLQELCSITNHICYWVQEDETDSVVRLAELFEVRELIKRVNEREGLL